MHVLVEPRCGYFSSEEFDPGQAVAGSARPPDLPLALPPQTVIASALTGPTITGLRTSPRKPISGTDAIPYVRTLTDRTAKGSVMGAAGFEPATSRV